jgi:hypothetical protein
LIGGIGVLSSDKLTFSPNPRPAAPQLPLPSLLLKRRVVHFLVQHEQDEEHEHGRQKEEEKEGAQASAFLERDRDFARTTLDTKDSTTIDIDSSVSMMITRSIDVARD